MSGAATLPAPAPARRDARPLPPADRAVPQLPALLDTSGMAAVLGRSMRAPAQVDEVRVRLVDYRPGSGCTVAYDVATGEERHIAVAATGNALPAAAARIDARTAIARALTADSPAARPLTYDVRLGALVHWYPLDLAMPVLARPVGDLLRLAERAGVAVDHDAPAARTLAYLPAKRAVLRAGGVVLKAYADRAAFRAGVAGLRAAGRIGLGGGSRLGGAFAGLRLTVQPAIAGTQVTRERAAEVGPVAGAMLRVLHEAPFPGLAPRPPRRVLAAAALAGRRAVDVAPELGFRVRRLLARLEERAPGAIATVPCHGDFNASQLLDTGGALALLDFDEMCAAAPALDVAAYAANLVGGRPGDLDNARVALEALVGGYGERPEALEWHLAAAILCRAPSPFRLHKKRWPERTAAIVAAAEEVLGR